MNDETKNENLPAVSDDGFDDGAEDTRIIKGELDRCVDGNWSEKDGTPIPPGTRRIVLGVSECVQRWQDQRPIETITDKPLPNVDELNDSVPKDEWEAGLDGEPRKPYVHQYIVYSLDPATAGLHTYINSTYGARLAVQALKDKVKLYRMIRGSRVYPIVELSKKQMKTKFGVKQRPEFIVHDWRYLGAPEVPNAEVKAIEHIGAPVKPPTTAEIFDDALPF
jgi:hypothetical protein